MNEKTYLDIIRYYLEKENFEFFKEKDIFVKSKNCNSAIGLNFRTNEIFIKCNFIENLIKKCIIEVIDIQITDLKRVKKELNKNDKKKN